MDAAVWVPKCSNCQRVGTRGGVPGVEGSGTVSGAGRRPVTVSRRILYTLRGSPHCERLVTRLGWAEDSFRAILAATSARIGPDYFYSGRHLKSLITFSSSLLICASYAVLPCLIVILPRARHLRKLGRFIIWNREKIIARA